MKLLLDFDFEGLYLQPSISLGRCVDNISSFTCACDEGYTGQRCESENNPCSPDPCHNNGYCCWSKRDWCSSVMPLGYFECYCKDGYTGESNQVLKDAAICIATPLKYLSIHHSYQNIRNRNFHSTKMVVHLCFACFVVSADACCCITESLAVSIFSLLHIGYIGIWTG